MRSVDLAGEMMPREDKIERLANRVARAGAAARRWEGYAESARSEQTAAFHRAMAARFEAEAKENARLILEISGNNPGIP